MNFNDPSKIEKIRPIFNEIAMSNGFILILMWFPANPFFIHISYTFSGYRSLKMNQPIQGDITMSISTINSPSQSLQQAAQTIAQLNNQKTSGQEQIKKGSHHHGGHRSNKAGGSQSTAPVSGISGTPTAANATTNVSGSIDTTA